MTEEKQVNYVFVDVEDKRSFVTVYDHDDEIDVTIFCNDRKLAEGARCKVSDRPYEDACAFAEKQAKKLGCEWGANI